MGSKSSRSSKSLRVGCALAFLRVFKTFGVLELPAPCCSRSPQSLLTHQLFLFLSHYKDTKKNPSFASISAKKNQKKSPSIPLIFNTLQTSWYLASSFLHLTSYILPLTSYICAPTALLWRGKPRVVASTATFSGCCHLTFDYFFDPGWLGFTRMAWEEKPEKPFHRFASYRSLCAAGAARRKQASTLISIATRHCMPDEIDARKTEKTHSLLTCISAWGFSAKRGFSSRKRCRPKEGLCCSASLGRKLAYSPMRDGSIGWARQCDAFGKGFRGFSWKSSSHQIHSRSASVSIRVIRGQKTWLPDYLIIWLFLKAHSFGKINLASSQAQPHSVAVALLLRDMLKGKIFICSRKNFFLKAKIHFDRSFFGQDEIIGKRGAKTTKMTRKSPKIGKIRSNPNFQNRRKQHEKRSKCPENG